MRSRSRAQSVGRDSSMGVHTSLRQAGGTRRVRQNTQVVALNETAGGAGALARALNQSRVPSNRAGAWSMNSGTGNSVSVGQIVFIGAYDDSETPASRQASAIRGYRSAVVMTILAPLSASR